MAATTVGVSLSGGARVTGSLVGSRSLVVAVRLGLPSVICQVIPGVCFDIVVASGQKLSVGTGGTIFRRDDE